MVKNGRFRKVIFGNGPIFGSIFGFFLSTFILEHLYEFNIADLRIEELVQLITEKDFMFLKMKIENNGDKQGESPNPYPLSYLTK